ncbi:DUF2844 domain-containing protein [Pararobbsia alpina]|uniref:DUF2844 domain-containing protein n=1 Tax=Pararobbsia alpina TaxID=621374 RepID=A0A6S7CNR2_9BURK|nr:DUF2844 domain-containing protein [Pararobbsia alpina]CAB3794267.1 hypothetical protein LMG28138_03658 [Pararobbsia alpina]
MSIRSNRWPGACCIALLWLPLHAFATLGGNAASVDADRTALGTAVATAASTTVAAPAAASATLPGANVQTLTLSSGTVVREYVSATGLVFAVSWQGPVLPQLKQLLGPDNFAQYINAQSRGGSQGFAGVDLPNLVVNSGGHMGAFFGRAWLPQSLPAGITAQDIQ